MENSYIDNVRGLSGVDFEGEDRHSSEKVARVYEFMNQEDIKKLYPWLKLTHKYLQCLMARY